MSRLHGTKEFWIGALRADGSAFHAAIAEAAPETPVLSCPGWTVADLARHLGSIYGWVRDILGSEQTETPPPRPRMDGRVEGSAEGAAVGAWWQRELDQLLLILDRIDPESPAWNWAPQPKEAVFWHRRMAHETAVHRWDAQMAIGTSAPIEAKIAADGVSEVFDTWLPGGRRRELGSTPGVVHLVATDVEQEWLLRLRGEGVALLDTDTILDDDDHHARTYATGTASDLLLALWGRVGFDVLAVNGDAALLEALRPGR